MHAVVVGCIVVGPSLAPMAQAEPKTEKTLMALMTDAQEVDTEVRNLRFYWKEKAKLAGSEWITVLVTLANGKTGEVVFTRSGSYRGE